MLDLAGLDHTRRRNLILPARQAKPSVCASFAKAAWIGRRQHTSTRRPEKGHRLELAVSCTTERYSELSSGGLRVRVSFPPPLGRPPNSMEAMRGPDPDAFRHTRGGLCPLFFSHHVRVGRSERRDRDRLDRAILAALPLSVRAGSARKGARVSRPRSGKHSGQSAGAGPALCGGARVGSGYLPAP